MRHHVRLVLLTLIYTVISSRAKILRNNALMSKMVSHFQKQDNYNYQGDRDKTRKRDRQEENLDQPPQELPQEASNENHKPEKVLSLMQNVLCRNFPTIPCSVIMHDPDLSKLIKRSIQQISSRKFNIDITTPAPRKSHTLSPLINSEDLSSFLEVANTGYFNEKADNKKQKKKKKQRSTQKMKNHWSHEKPSKKKIKGTTKENKKGTEMFGNRKKMRKFYPHKIKYKDKANKRGEFRDTDEKVSMSVEVPEMNGVGPPMPQKTDMSFNMESPVWRIDYMKHGIPSLNTFGYDDEKFSGKLMKSRPEMIVEETAGEQQPRKEVLHPDVFIKKNFVRKNRNNMNVDDLE